MHRISLGKALGLVVSTLVLGVVTLGTRAGSTRSIRRIGHRLPAIPWLSPDPRSISWAIGRGRRVLPLSTDCLDAAVTAELLLRLTGQEGAVRLGVHKTAAGRLEAHAWVTSGECIVVGGSGRDRYTPLSATEEGAP